MPTIVEGDVIHGTLSCTNVYRVMSFGQRPVKAAQMVVLLQVIQIGVQPNPMGLQIANGEFILRARAILDTSHLAKGCPNDT